MLNLPSKFTIAEHMLSSQRNVRISFTKYSHLASHNMLNLPSIFTIAEHMLSRLNIVETPPSNVGLKLKTTSCWSDAL
jgi:hypothetical protein